MKKHVFILVLQVTNIKRQFLLVKDGKGKPIELTDPNGDMSPEEVMKFHSGVHAELTNGVIEGPKVSNGIATYTISTKAGKLG